LLLGISGGLPLLICAGIAALVYGVKCAYTKQQVIRTENKLNTSNGLQLFSNDGLLTQCLNSVKALNEQRNKMAKSINITKVNLDLNQLVSHQENFKLPINLQLFSGKDKALIVKSGFMHATTGWAVSCIILSIFVVVFSATPVGWLTYAIGGLCALSFAISGILSKNNHLHSDKFYENKHDIMAIDQETKIEELNVVIDKEIHNLTELNDQLKNQIESIKSAKHKSPERSWWLTWWRSRVPREAEALHQEFANKAATVSSEGKPGGQPSSDNHHLEFRK
jgi:hypothetical protein